ncbi:hypothetical protein Pla108_30700 [Botrimarina colliarenosi]|uniref:Ice-binding protein C-terminal domain-containing protein n=1 Tax=Botrimarina colliarenosi TaxID=2528001 RepID=A0A5C6AAC8_9BACT|nr:PEP-CTERM sorting domain-containing protein [Botrimarina colliarenosi]TWT95991.1 hypothetical protein Pla108_30700 [Botrimarina colliarenosi]
MISKSCHLLACVTCLVAGVSVQGGRIYELIDYPTYQNGATLRGTITVNEAAFAAAAAEGRPLSLLPLDAVEAYEFSITTSDGQTFSTGPVTSFEDFYPTDVYATESSILLGLPGQTSRPPSLTLGEVLRTGGQIEKASYLFYVFNNQRTIFSASIGDGSSSFIPWSADPGIDGLGGSPWVIARLIPEPGTLVIAAAGLAAANLSRQSRRVAGVAAK